MTNVSDEDSVAGKSLKDRFDVEPVYSMPVAKSDPIVRTSQIVWGVFWGMWAFAATASIVWFGIIALLR